MIPSEVSDEDMEGAIANIARTADGQLLYCWLQRELMGVVVSSDPGALHANQGHRTFAAKLMALMGPAIAESAGAPGRSADDERGRIGRPVVFAGRKPAAVTDRRRGVGRRIKPDQHVDGWDEPTDK